MPLILLLPLCFLPLYNRFVLFFLLFSIVQTFAYFPTLITFKWFLFFYLFLLLQPEYANRVESAPVDAGFRVLGDLLNGEQRAHGGAPHRDLHPSQEVPPGGAKLGHTAPTHRSILPYLT